MARRASKMSLAIDGMAEGLYGHLRGIEDFFEGDMSMSGQVLDQALGKFIEDVRDEGGEVMALEYMERFLQTMRVRLAIEEAKE